MGSGEGITFVLRCAKISSKAPRNESMTLRHATHHDARKAPEASDINLLVNLSFRSNFVFVWQFIFVLGVAIYFRFRCGEIFVAGQDFHQLCRRKQAKLTSVGAELKRILKGNYSRE